jgi:heme/copper-type cytochrome/quinol oxidase subunit 2
MAYRQFAPSATAEIGPGLSCPRRRVPGWTGVWIVAIPLLLTVSVQAQTPAFSVTIRNHRFVPDQIEVPANQKVEVHVINADPTPAEFESFELRREKVVAAGQEITLYIGPLKPGSYEFFDDFNPSARGHVVAR